MMTEDWRKIFFISTFFQVRKQHRSFAVNTQFLDDILKYFLTISFQDRFWTSIDGRVKSLKLFTVKEMCIMFLFLEIILCPEVALLQMMGEIFWLTFGPILEPFCPYLVNFVKLHLWSNFGPILTHFFNLFRLFLPMFWFDFWNSIVILLQS